MFEGNGVATRFPFNFKVWNVNQLRVVVADRAGVARQVSPQSVELADSGGVVVCTHEGRPLPVGWKLVILRDMPFIQNVDLISGTRFDPQVIEDQMDQAAAERQQLLEEVGRAVKVPPASDNPPEILAELIFEARDSALSSAGEAAASAAAAEGSAMQAREALEATITAHDEAMADISGNLSASMTAIDVNRADSLAQLARQADIALLDVDNARQNALSQIVHSGETQVANVTAAGSNLAATATQAQEHLVLMGDAQEGRVRAAGNAAVLNVILEGDSQRNALQQGTTSTLLQISGEVLKAEQQADRAEAAAERAEAVTDVHIATKQRLGLVKVGSGLGITEDGTLYSEIPSFLSNPVADFPADAAIGYPALLSMSSSTAIPDAVITHFSVVFDGEPPVEVAATDGAGQLSLTPAGTVHGQQGQITVTAFDSNGNSSNDTVRTFTKKIVTVRAPRILSPVEGEADVPLFPTLALQTGGSDGMPSTNEMTQVRVMDIDGALVWDSGEVPYAVSVPVTVELPHGVTVQAQARHKVSTYGWSDWGAPTSFGVIRKSVSTPRIVSPAQGAVEQALNVAVIVSALSTTGYGPQGGKTRLMLARDTAFTDVVFDTGQEHAYGVSIATANLPVNTLLYARVRHCDTRLGWSAWSAVSAFTTLNAYTNRIAVTEPANGAGDVTPKPTVTVAAFTNTGPADTAKATQIQISADAQFTDIAAQHDGGYVTSFTPAVNLALLTAFYVRARHQGTIWGWGAWSPTVTFTTMNAFANPPAITAPAANATNVLRRPAVTVAAFSNTGPTDKAVQTEIQIGTDAAFATVAASYSGAYLTSWTVPKSLGVNTGYYIRARHKGETWGWSAWGAASRFTTANISVGAPSITAPASGATSVALAAKITLSAGAGAGPGTFVFTNTEVQVATDAAFANVAVSTTGSYLTAWTVGTALALNTLYYVRARHTATNAGDTYVGAWSAVTSFRTIAPTLATPVLAAPTNNAVDQSVTPTLRINDPAVKDQTRAKVRFQVSTVNTFASTVFDSGDIAYANTRAVPTLAKNTKYYARARVQGSITGWTAWSAVVAFTTAAAAPGDTWNFTAATGSWNCPVSGMYSLECAGGRGGKAVCPDNDGCGGSEAAGGRGGYAKKDIRIAKGTVVSLITGAKGGDATSRDYNCQFNAWLSVSGGGTSSVTIDANVLISATGGAGGSCSRGNWGWGYCVCSAGSRIGADGTGIGGDVNNATSIDAGYNRIKLVSY